ncbi:MIF-like protein mif-2 [Diadema setosum]|uniref:MIF-like protein mif-2 n=1 Tax=Diadema antillarum TaxID=105358 RepID=UPI003A87CC62
MPLAVFTTNVPQKSLPSDFSQNFSRLLSELLGVDELGITIVVRAGENVIRKTSDPTGYVQFYNIPFDSIDAKRQATKKINDFVKKSLKTTQENRVFVVVHEVSAENVALEAGLVADILKQGK